MIDEIVIIGRPGLVGGADTELFDQIKVWLKMGLKCRVIPTSEAVYPINYSHPNLFIEEIRRYSECSGKHVISYCNPIFLKDIDVIRKYAKSISWVNCMCFNFKQEIEAHKKGLIDFFLYQTKHQFEKCASNLISVNDNFTAIPIIPYFDCESFPFIENRKQLSYGRISRAGSDKYSDNQFQIYATAELGNDINCLILGWSDELHKRFNNDISYKEVCDWNSVKFYKQNDISSQQFYKDCGIICMSTNTYENLPRVGFEAMASGSVLIVDNRGGWKTQVDHGVTGYLCDNTNDFAHHLLRLISRPDIRDKFAKNARQKLEAEHSYKASASRWENFFKILT